MNMVNNMNSLIIEGNLTRDAEAREPKEGFFIARFPIAVDRWTMRGGQAVQDASFFDVKAYGALVKECKEQAKKGVFVRVVGHLKQERWTDKSGNRRTKVYIIAEHLEFKNVASKADKAKGMREAVKAHEDAINYSSIAKVTIGESAPLPAIKNVPQVDAVF